MKKKSITRKQATAKKTLYPKGWNRKRAQTLADYYDSQSDEEAIVEAEAAYKDGKSAMIQVPMRLVPAVRKLLARRAG